LVSSGASAMVRSAKRDRVTSASFASANEGMLLIVSWRRKFQGLSENGSF
jgi:hypothetical protein